MRTLVVLSLFVAATAAAQGPAATKATGAKAPATKTQAPATKTQQRTTKTASVPTQAGQRAAGQPQRRPALAIASETAPAVTPPIMRELFTYDAGGRRDPFVSLLQTTELRPTVADLRLVGVLYDESGRRPVAIMRDLVTNTQYRVTTGMTLGRMRVATIKRRSVIFTIEEFGLNRQDSLVLGDTTKVRAR